MFLMPTPRDGLYLKRLLSGCSITGVTDNVCGDEACTPGEFGYTCGKRRERTTTREASRIAMLVDARHQEPHPVFDELTPAVHQLLPTNTNSYPHVSDAAIHDGFEKDEQPCSHVLSASADVVRMAYDSSVICMAAQSTAVFCCRNMYFVYCCNTDSA